MKIKKLKKTEEIQQIQDLQTSENSVPERAVPTTTQQMIAAQTAPVFKDTLEVLSLENLIVLGQNNGTLIIGQGKEESPRKPVGRQPAVSRKKNTDYTLFTQQLNRFGKFSYLDYNRNVGAINLFKTQVNQLISLYGCDLQYFRKFNTFFKGQAQNNSNLIYGQDTTAQYYASGMIRSYVSVENMAWNFNQLGIQNTQQVNIIMTIQNFQQIFARDTCQIETKYFQVPVYGNVNTGQVTGMIISDTFTAAVAAQVDEDLNTYNVNVNVVQKLVNKSFYAIKTYDLSFYPISGTLSGRVYHDQIYPLILSGVLSGQLTYHNFENNEQSKTWQIAPQVGDYFKFQVQSGIDQEWQINQVFDRLLMNKSGINPLLGKYIYQCTAVKRVNSYQKNSLANQPQPNIDQIFNQSKKKQQDYADQYLVDSTGDNKHNKKTNKIAKNIYDYQKKEDLVYGGYQNQAIAKVKTPKSKKKATTTSQS